MAKIFSSHHQAGRLLLALTFISFATTACSQKQQELSEREKDIDKQKEVQIKTVDRTTDVLKEGVERQKEQNLQSLEAGKKQLEIAKDNLEAKKKEIKAAADFDKKNLEKQAEVSKKVVDRNAEVAKDELKDMAR